MSIWREKRCLPAHQGTHQKCASSREIRFNIPQTENELNSIQQGKKMAKFSTPSGNSLYKGTIDSDSLIEEALPVHQ